MRHFLIGKLGTSIAVTGLSCRLQPPAAVLAPIRDPSAMQRVTPLS
jgi:hypothetical protein